MIDIEVLESWFNFFMGMVVAIGGAYTAMKSQGKIVYPAAKIEAGRAKIAALLEGNALIEEAQTVVGTISLEELAGIIQKAQELSKEGFTAGEAQELGILIMDAVKNN